MKGIYYIFCSHLIPFDLIIVNEIIFLPPSSLYIYSWTNYMCRKQLWTSNPGNSMLYFFLELLTKTKFPILLINFTIQKQNHSSETVKFVNNKNLDNPIVITETVHIIHWHYLYTYPKLVPNHKGRMENIFTEKANSVLTTRSWYFQHFSAPLAENSITMH